jgi:hypothetical protein
VTAAACVGTSDPLSKAANAPAARKGRNVKEYMVKKKI